MRFMLGALTVLFAAALAWPFVPRSFESTALLVLRPNHGAPIASSEAMRHPLDDNAVQSEIDTVGSSANIDLLLRTHRLAEDPEFADLSLSEKLVAQMPLRWISDMVPGIESLSPNAVVPIPSSTLRENVRSRMIVRRDRRSYTLEIGFRSADADKARAMAQTLVDAYLEAQIERKRHAAALLKYDLEHQVEAARQRLDASRTAYLSFLTDTGLLDHGAQISLEAQLGALSTELATTRSRVIEARAHVASLTSLEREDALESAPEVLASPTVQALRDRMTTALSRVSVAPSETQVIARALDAEIARILRSAARQAETWSAREAMLQSEIETIREALAFRREAELEAERREFEARSDQDVLEVALQQLKNFVDNDSYPPDAEVIVAPETPAAPASPRLPLVLAATLLVACLAGALMNWRLLLSVSRRLLTH